jgi:hypothetical protein
VWMTNGSICVYEMWGQCQNSKSCLGRTLTSSAPLSAVMDDGHCTFSASSPPAGPARGIRIQGGPGD